MKSVVLSHLRKYSPITSSVYNETEVQLLRKLDHEIRKCCEAVLLSASNKLLILTITNMAAQPAAGPSNPLKVKRSRTSAKAIKPRKAKKISEKQRIFELEKAALEFVSSKSLLSVLLTE